MSIRHIQTADDLLDGEIITITDDIISGTLQAVAKGTRVNVEQIVLDALIAYCHSDRIKGFRANIRQETSTFVRRLRERREAILKQTEATAPKSSRRRW